MISNIKLSEGQKVYFASDFHLGVPSKEGSLVREKKIVRWLTQIEKDAAAIFLVGDIFDFWFEYKHAIPKGFSRFQGKLAELTDKGIPVYFFTGNHDVWMFDYFPSEFNIPVIRKPISIEIGTKKFHIGHGDGLGPGDYVYKQLKKIFTNKTCQWLFARLHPNFGIGFANSWSKSSRAAHSEKEETSFGDKEWIIQYCKDVEKNNHHDFYIFGHRHLPIDFPLNDDSKYLNLGEWVHYCTYAEFDGNTTTLKTYEN